MEENDPQETLAGRFITIAEKNPNRPAIADSSGRKLSYAETLTESWGIANWLTETRPRGTNIGVILPSGVPAALTNYGITLSGKTAVNLNFTAGPRFCRAAIDLCGIETVITSRVFIERLGIPPLPEMVFVEDRPVTSGTPGPAPGTDRDSLACIVFSSGSTGVPKGVELTHSNIVANADGLASRIPPKTDDCMLGVLPFFHSFGYTFALWFPVLHGIRAAYHSNPSDAKTIGDLASSHKATYFVSTPTFCQQYAQKLERHQFSSLKYILVGAEKLRDSIASQFANHFGIELLAGYGCTELGPGVAVNTPWEARPGSVGLPLEGIEIRIVDPATFAPLPPSEQGMILINGPSRMRGYHKAPELTAQAMCGDFYVTGDLGFVDSDGYLYVTDRLARFSKVAGEMVPHLRIEEAVSALTPAFVTGLPDTRRGERLILLYTNPETNPYEIYKRLQGSGLPSLWIPKREDIHAIPTMPVLANGKLDLMQARQLAASIAS